MRIGNFLETSLSVQHFWPMVSAASAALTVLAVFLLPVINTYIRKKSVLQIIQNELSETARQMEGICRAWEARKNITDGSTGYNEVMVMEAIAKRISCECWDRFRFELDPDAYQCLKPFFIAAKDTIDPRASLASNDPEKIDPFTLAQMRATYATDFLAQLKKTAPKCKYLRLPR